jgi:hypothetical protein
MARRKSLPRRHHLPGGALDLDARDAKGRAALEHLERGDAPHPDAGALERGGQVGERHVEVPEMVRRVRRKIDPHPAQRRHVGGGEHHARILGVPPAVGVVEGGEELAFPQEHLPSRRPYRGPRRGVRRHATHVLLMRGGRDDLVGLARIEPTVIRGVGAGDDGLGLEHLQRHRLTRLRLHAPHHVVLEGQRVDDEESLGGPADLDGAGIVERVHPHRAAVHGGDAEGIEPQDVAPQATDLDAVAPLHYPDPARAEPCEGPSDEIAEDQRAAAELDDARALGERHPNVAARPRRHRARRREDEDERDDRQQPRRCSPPTDEHQYQGQDDRHEDGRREGEVEAEVAALDVDVAGQSTDPWHLSQEAAREPQGCSQDYHDGPDAEEDFAQVGHATGAGSRPRAGQSGSSPCPVAGAGRATPRCA